VILYHVCKSSVTFNTLTNLKPFPNLYRIFKSVSYYRNLSEENPILKNSQNDNARSSLYLRSIENALDILDIGNWPIKEKKALISRLTSNNSSESFAVLNELEAYLSLIGNIGVENVSRP
jgi:hypothetical protein